MHTILVRSHDLGGVFSNILPTFWPDTCCGVRVRCEARRGRLCAQCKKQCKASFLYVMLYYTRGVSVPKDREQGHFCSKHSSATVRDRVKTRHVGGTHG